MIVHQTKTQMLEFSVGKFEFLFYGRSNDAYCHLAN